jgi:hypothetical protein
MFSKTRLDIDSSKFILAPQEETAGEGEDLYFLGEWRSWKSVVADIYD